MLLYRIARTEHIRDLSGEGARLYGGRWNHRGTPLIYTSETRALATIEFAVHAALTQAPAALSLATLEVARGASVSDLDESNLPDGWRHYPPPSELPNLGSSWAVSKETLLLRVPSAVVPHESNILINPLHPEIAKAKLVEVEEFRLDGRLTGTR